VLVDSDHPDARAEEQLKLGPRGCGLSAAHKLHAHTVCCVLHAAYGPHAQAVADRLHSGGLSCKVPMLAATPNDVSFWPHVHTPLLLQQTADDPCIRRVNAFVEMTAVRGLSILSHAAGS
jgi:hypothetical protein